MNIIEIILGRKHPAPPQDEEMTMLAKKHVETLKRVEQVVRMARVDAEVEAQRR